MNQLIAVAAIVLTTAVIIVPTVSAQGGGSKGEPKSWHMTQLQRLGIVFILYSQDWDDRMPQAIYKRHDGNQSWAPSILVPSPANVVVTPPWQEPERIAAASRVWRNSTTFYAPYPTTSLPGAPEHSVAGDIYSGTPNLTHPIMNGLLHCYSWTAIENPAIVPMVWPGVSRTNLKGRTFSQPVLNCLDGPDCLFNPTGPPSSIPGPATFDATSYMFNYPVWIFGQTAPIIRADSSVALVPTGLKIEPDMHQWPNVTTDPWAQVSANGTGLSMWYCGPGHTAATPSWPVAGQGAYPCYFRPDRTE